MTTKVKVVMPNGDTKVFHRRDGMSFEEVFVKQMEAGDLDLQLDLVKETPIRDDDVIIVAYPKTGTHWTWEIANMVQRGETEYHKHTKEVAFIDFCSQEMTASMTSPRILNTHLTHNLLPAGIKEKRCKIINVMRNPKDVAVSFYFHLFNELGPEKSDPFDVFMKIFRGELAEMTYCSYLTYLKHWEQFEKDNPDYPLLNLFYEDMKADPEGEIRKIIKFLGKDIDDATVAEINTKCNFKNMKEGHSDKIDNFADKTVTGNTAYMYRKGEVGDWKNYLTVAENEAFDKWIESEMKDSKIKFRYE